MTPVRTGDGTLDEFAPDWTLLDHCGARNLLESKQWRYVSAGDWAVVLSDPTQRLAARISPFERAYQYFVKLCNDFPLNPWLPRIHFATELEGGGHLAVLDLLTPRELPDEDAPAGFWDGSDDADLVALRAEVERVDKQNQENHIPWWGGLDVKAGHFMLGHDGRLKLVDPFFVDGAALYAAARNDYPGFAKQIPVAQHKYMLQIPRFSEDYMATSLAALRAAIP